MPTLSIDPETGQRTWTVSLEDQGVPPEEAQRRRMPAQERMKSASVGLGRCSRMMRSKGKVIRTAHGERFVPAGSAWEAQCPVEATVKVRGHVYCRQHAPSAPD